MSPSGSSKLPEVRDRDRWWAFFREDVDWENILSSQFHGKNAGGNDKRKRETVDYKEALPRESGKMRGWVVYEEKLSWDQAEDEVTALKYGCGGELPEAIHKGKRKEDAHWLLVMEISWRLPMTIPRYLATLPHESLLLDQRTTFHLLKYFTQCHFDRSFYQRRHRATLRVASMILQPVMPIGYLRCFLTRMHS
ncbi:hypothetical protein K439DRAFT_1656208 [Ramaria rubella]|nr:hypothetical protein K439DRAFT_1656208 [Ramaria rubella]